MGWLNQFGLHGCRLPLFLPMYEDPGDVLKMNRELGELEPVITAFSNLQGQISPCEKIQVRLGI